MEGCDINCQTRRVFDSQKKQALDGVDLSRKGCIDAAIIDIVRFINMQANMFTLSSCSGRVCVFEEVQEGVKKKGCSWLYTTHVYCDYNLISESLKKSTGDASMKFEAFILHVQCYRMKDAQLIHSTAVASGLRNSGISISKGGKIVAAVRSTHGLEIPLTHNGEVVVTPEYIRYVSDKANQSMDANLVKIEKFATQLRTAIEELSTSEGSLKAKRRQTTSRDLDHRDKISPPDSDISDKISPPESDKISPPESDISDIEEYIMDMFEERE